MREQGMTADVAATILTAFVHARQQGLPEPVDSVVMDESAPAYLYETPRLSAASVIATNDRRVRVRARAQKPALAVLSDVLSEDECAQLIALARGRLRPSTIVDPISGKDIVADHRSSQGMFFRLQETPFIARLDQRMAEIMNLPVDHGEGIQVLHYPAGAFSAPHYDFLVPSNAANQAALARSGQRVSTMVTYLNDVEEGGETLFPHIGWSVSPQRGNAVHFEFCNSLDQVDHASLHAGGAVVRGEKWVATKWMRQRRFVSADTDAGMLARPASMRTQVPVPTRA